MDIKQLRDIQGPLKEKYKQNPQTALINIRAEGIIEGHDISCRILKNIETDIAGLHPAAGGDGSKACSAEILMESLVACAGVTMKAVATAMRLEITHTKVIAECVWDARGTLGVDREAPVGLSNVNLTFEFQNSADPEKLERLVQLTERYCVIFQTLANPPKLVSRYKVV